ncbi:MAG: hypothetical protein IIB53_04790 [Planctomycetes bacterium]|nr:hypothetical protein [Planctomycetota bacterium]
MNYWVYALTEYNGELIAGGQFAHAGGTPANRIARWDGTTWSPLGSGMNWRVRALTGYYNGDLIAGGSFTFAGETPANYIARWDGTTWSPLGSGMGGGDYYADVQTLTEYNGELIAGGYFTTADGMPANGIARWDGASWSPLGNGITGSIHDCPPVVNALAVYNGDLIAGGEFTTAGGMPASSIARWDGTSWSPLGSGMSAPGDETVHSLTVYNGELIAGGYFTGAGGTEASRIARWDGTSWSPLGRGMGGGQYPYVNAVTVYDGELIAGGWFTTADGQVSAYWARWGPDVPLGDLDGDCTVGRTDLDILLATWGPCADCKLPGDCPADLDGDCTVGVVDLLILLGNWG